MAFPAHVIEIKEQLKEHAVRDPYKAKLLGILCKLTEPKAAVFLEDLEGMWRALEKRTDSADLEDGNWVVHFLRAALEASALPPYASISGQDRRELMDKIKELSKELSEILSEDDLDAHVVLSNERLLDYKTLSAVEGLYVLEDLCEFERSLAGTSDCINEIVSFLTLLNFFVERSDKKIGSIGNRSKAGENSGAVGFVRALGKRNQLLYGKKTRLNKVLATAVNAIFATKYAESDIANLCKGIGKE